MCSLELLALIPMNLIDFSSPTFIDMISSSLTIDTFFSPWLLTVKSKRKITSSLKISLSFLFSSLMPKVYSRDCKSVLLPEVRKKYQ